MVLLALWGEDSWFLQQGSNEPAKKNVPSNIDERFTTGGWSGLTLLYLATGPNGYFYGENKLNQTYNAVLHRPNPPETLHSVLGGTFRPVKFLSISSTGGFFLRYDNPVNAVQWYGPLPPNFLEHIRELRANRQVPRNEHSILMVLFGHGKSFIVQYENGKVIAYNLNGEPAATWNKRVNDGWKFALTESSLCWWNPNYFLFTWEKDGRTVYEFNLPRELHLQAPQILQADQSGGAAGRELGQRLIASATADLWNQRLAFSSLPIG